MSNIVIFASGSGTNAERIMRTFQNHPFIKVKLVLSNKKNAGVLERAKKLNVKTFVFNKEEFYQTDVVLHILLNEKIDFIVLAGFLWLVPEKILRQYPNRIINIHPALLPAYGGKGMYGQKVHEAVIANHEKESGITIHYVNSEYDRGEIIFQARCPVLPDDTPETLAERVHQLEYQYYPEVIEKLLSKKD
ncbi:MAG: phosphoribosylglycinamide formyltransferase [Bacteroidales bacterium]|nr:phosphoribosylglycinamide formyltransferase [Bacteroidales bacterium]